MGIAIIAVCQTQSFRCNILICPCFLLHIAHPLFQDHANRQCYQTGQKGHQSNSPQRIGLHRMPGICLGKIRIAGVQVMRNTAIPVILAEII